MPADVIGADRDAWTRVVDLRKRLSEEDQLVVELRVARAFSWKDIARITLGPARDDAEVVEREAARLRKRFELAKQQLRAWAKTEGLLPDGGDSG